MPDPALAESLVDRPISQRLQEFRYRLGQSLVFGLPVLALQWFGRDLGGVESDRWVAVFQALLAGWVVYVGAAGMVAEGTVLLLARRQVAKPITLNALIGAAAVGIYLLGLPRLIALLAGSLRPAPYLAGAFACAVLLIGLWSAFQTWRLRRRGHN